MGQKRAHMQVCWPRGWKWLRWDEVGWTDGTGLVIVRMPQFQPGVWSQIWLAQRFCVVWGELVSCGVGRAGHDRNLETGGDAGRGG